MTRLFNDPDAFADEMIDGFVAPNRLQVRRVPSGVVLRFTQAKDRLLAEGGSLAQSRDTGAVVTR